MVRQRMRRRVFIHCVKLTYNLCVIFIIGFILLYITRSQNNTVLFPNITKCGRKYIQFSENEHNIPNTIELKLFIEKNNKEEVISNQDKYGSIPQDTVILVVNVNQNIDSLKLMLASLCEVKGIEETLIIFSHKYHDVNINNLIESIEFCRVLQIFYPFSLQVFNHEFPGFTIGDCPTNIDIRKAERLNCTGASFPDIHAKYRDPQSSEKKHHWWWTANKIFDTLSRKYHHSGLVVFIEESVFFIEDFLYMMLKMKEIAETLPQCDFLSLGTDSPSVRESNAYRLDFMTWDPSRHANVFVFDILVWNTLLAHYKLFCSVDDSSWERSLLFVSLNRKNGKRFKVLSSTYPRAQKLPKDIKMFSNQLNYFLKVLNFQRMINLLFPSFLEVYTDIELDDDEYVIFDILKGKGGWSDPRDLELCKNITSSKLKNVFDTKVVQ